VIIQAIKARVGSLSQLIASTPNLLKSKFNEINITKKLEKWFELTFIDLQKDLKTKIKMSLSDESDWIDFFELQSKSYSEIATSINSLENE